MQQGRIPRIGRLHCVPSAVQHQGKHLPAYLIVIDHQDLNRHLSRFLHKDYQSTNLLYHYLV
jgi:hypothetical protein